jgi:hydroxymethylglutaryl-CoA lyase
VEIARQYLDAGIDELALADSTGMANPLQIKRMLEAVLPLAGDVPVVLHLHDTRGLGLANVMAALEIGVRQFDTAFGGLGGCPFIAGAAGNIATEDTLYLLESLEIATGVDRVRVARVAQDLVARLGRELSGKLYKLN